MHIAVLIVSFRNPDDVARCLAALERSTHADFEVVVCENGGPDAHAAAQARFPTVLAGGRPLRLICAPKNLGYAGGVNLCLAAAADADAWSILNPDTEPAPDALARLVGRLGAGDCDAVGSTVHYPGGPVQSHGGHWQGALARTVSIGYGAPVDEAPDPARIERLQNYLSGASMLVGRRFVETAGPMREDYFLYCEEVEWCLRGLARGMRLGFAPGALVLHHQGTTMGQFADLRRRGRLPIHLGERNKINLTRDCRPAATPLVVAFALPLLVYRYGRRGAWKQILYGLGGWWAGVVGERGAPKWIEG